MKLAALQGAVVASAVCALASARGDTPAPPWVADGEVPPSPGARSVAPRADDDEPGDLVLFAGPSRASGRRGVGQSGAALPFFGVRRGPGCGGVWWLVGPLAWVCSDDATLSGESPHATERTVGKDGLYARYFFVRGAGASAYASLDAAEEGASDRELEAGWAVAVVEQRTATGADGAQERFVRTSKGLWIALGDLAPTNPSFFHGESVEGDALDVAWVLADRASVWAEPSTRAKPKTERSRFELVHVRQENGSMVRVDEGGWMLARELARPTVAPPPPPATVAGERWIDIDVASQTLVAYEGTRPVYATLVSTGRGSTPTPAGVHRVWVKLEASDMEGSAGGDGEARYSLEDVPYTQFFDGAVALHGAYWHRDFGHVHSHGCVNLSPLDARFLFAFTGPHVPAGWVAAYPTPVDEGTVVRVR